MTATMWWIVALLLAVSELLSGTFFALMLALAAAVTALAVHMGLADGLWQGALFAVLSVALCGAWYRRKPRLLKPHANNLNRGPARWLGREFTLAEELADGEGRVALDDTFWHLRGPDCAPGTRVKVVAVEGNTLVVKPL